jgi:hypothetical protein
MASAYSYSAYPVPQPKYQYRVDSMYQAAPAVYHNMPVAPPGLSYPTTLPGYEVSGQIHRPPSPSKQFALPISASKPIIQYQPPVPSIIPTREWLLEALKCLVFTNKGILIGDYPKFEIRKKNVIDKFHKQIKQLYPSSTYNITKEWLDGAMANKSFLPELAARLEEFPITACMRICMSLADFNKLTTDLIQNIEKYFNVKAEFNEKQDMGVRKIILHFQNNYIPDGQHFVFFVEQSVATSPLSIKIPIGEMQHQYDYLAYDGNVYSVLDTYSNYMTNSSSASTSSYLDTSVDSLIILFEIVNNVRNGIVVFMSYAEIDGCIETILAARKQYLEKLEQQEQSKKKEKSMLVFDKFISSSSKLDFFIKIFDTGCVMDVCVKCKVGIESGDIMCSTKCCRQTMHPSCMLELYLHENNKHATFQCDKCNIKRPDKYGRNTEMLMGLMDLGI